VQPLVTDVRSDLTAAEVTALIQDADAVRVAAGAELLDMDLTVLEDITDDFSGGSVSRNSYSTLHGSSTFVVGRPLDWGRAILRPYMTMSDGVTTARFNLGAYLTSVPVQGGLMMPPVYAVSGFDLLAVLADTVGDAYAVSAGTGYLAAVEAILVARGFTGYLIDQSAAAAVLPEGRVWELDDRTTWLAVVNDLLASIGYAGIWSDWDGRLRCAPYVAPIDRAPEWYYTAGGDQSMIGPDRTRTRDFFDAPNRWVAVRSNQIDGTPPVEGDGIYTYTNDIVGDTSVEARGGRVITRVMMLDVADHAALVSLAEQSIAADLDLRQKISMPTAPNPLHWHFDRLVIADEMAGPTVDAMGTSWTLPLNGGDMSHEMSVL
jgi:hypothetical protein